VVDVGAKLKRMIHGMADYRLRLRVTKRCDLSHTAISEDAKVTCCETEED
jgi:hypothetical protein